MYQSPTPAKFHVNAHASGWRRRPNRAGAIPSVLLLTIALAFSQIMPTQAFAKNDWVSAHYKDHPLAGTIWSQDFKPVTEAQLDEAVTKAKYILLGEIHVNPDHHLLQAKIIEMVARKGRRPAIVFEMIPEKFQGALDVFPQTGAEDASDLGDILHWAELGWPDWSIYQPIADAALAAKLTLLAGAPNRDTQKALPESTPPKKYEQMYDDFRLSEPLKPEIMKALEKEIDEGHCNMMPATAIPRMIQVQRMRDAFLAKAMLSPKVTDGAVLIAGAGHIRKDWAVPNLIRQKMPDADIISIAFLEVDPDRASPSDYSLAVEGLGQPFDFIYLTPSADLTDQCEEMRKYMKKKKSRQQ